ncbi:condensin subunit ScpB [Faunimonas pinastri]|uniref:Condensin subunit ScpB n=1 Tax=Faunimonas pinastri TaxID=1855383 RepID=A0A1H9CSW0_9HYPH|nr:SMC-Scp complex subunit ScpB [Faunimonas pinastri]SEQ04157.1 condensin subunit ScpB [Faunimonas pinastri]
MADVVSLWDSSGGRAQNPERKLHLRMAEAILFASREPLSEAELGRRMPEGIEIRPLLLELQQVYAARGVTLRRIGEHWAFRTADDLRFLLQHETVEQRKLSRAALETLSIIAYHQPVTRAEIEEIRGVSTSKGIMDVLLETGWVRLRGRRRVPGRPVTFGTTPAFLDHFGLEAITDLPGLAELKGAGLLEAAIPAGMQSPEPRDDEELHPDEDPLDEGDQTGFADGEDPAGEEEADGDATRD